MNCNAKQMSWKNETGSTPASFMEVVGLIFNAQSDQCTQFIAPTKYAVLSINTYIKDYQKRNSEMFRHKCTISGSPICQV
jgi:hypothetical protein